MPHVSIKHFPAELTQEQKQGLSDAITTAIQNALQCDEKVISIAMESIPPQDWSAAVYQPEIESKHQHLIKQPDY
ncbi:tautomerase PptA [Photobacterium sp. 1_MG-2023]|uniref:tautomerase PptA n=1 Tax=Photobacterium sp. 1_MG-2023 TaxID=3062646 RepID=UPI0026E19EA6|nr:tautomerase PptA [Photobacterium sp. 1_MG-2023]MDO6708101.1 tautomerase PptA [Photobacterium sp. 1_MG-2023]